MSPSLLALALLLCASLIQGCTFGSSRASGPSSPPSEQLVGDWEGQREAGAKCPFVAWRLTRTADGKFDIVFYSDPDKIDATGREHGRWWVKADRFYLQTEGVETPERYTYVILDQNTVRFDVVDRDPSADCQADYQFTDHRSADDSAIDGPPNEAINALWNDTGTDQTIGFWLYKKPGGCPSIRKQRPVVFAPKDEKSGGSASDLDVRTLQYCFELYPEKGKRINNCAAGSISYRYLPETNRYSGEYRIDFANGEKMAGQFLAEYCVKSQ